MEPLEWIHSLISLDTMHVRPGPKFCDEEGYDIHPLNMISLVGPNEPEVNISHLLLDEVSERVEQLEKLDETRLLAIVGMYAEKRRRKQWFDKNLKDKNFAVGDLVLLYTLKKNKRKLKKRGLGPYVIHSLLSSGAVKLAILDGEEMLAFINGSRLKKFYEPLTQPMLEQIHSTKTKK